MELNVQVTGVKEVIRFLQKTGTQQQLNTARAMNNAALFMEGEVKSSIAGQRNEPASVDTGRFLNSVSSTIEINSGQVQAVVFTMIDYAKYLEYGTSRIPSRRHFGNSLDRNRSKLSTMFQETTK